jgi:DNA-binding response OmpR family regulator
VLLIHHNKTVLKTLVTLVQNHEFLAVDKLLTGVKQIPRIKPDVIVVGHDKKKQEALRLLRYMRDNVIRTPVIVVFSGGGGSAQPMLMKLGAKALLEHPVSENELQNAISSCLRTRAEELAGPRPITEEELNSNLSLLETKLNRDMKCFAGKNQVYIQSIILGGGARTKPRIALKCPLRGEYGLTRDVYYEFIRDICCTDPTLCEAVQQFNAERESA